MQKSEAEIPRRSTLVWLVKTQPRSFSQLSDLAPSAKVAAINFPVQATAPGSGTSSPPSLPCAQGATDFANVGEAHRVAPPESGEWSPPTAPDHSASARFSSALSMVNAEAGKTTTTSPTVIEPVARPDILQASLPAAGPPSPLPSQTVPPTARGRARSIVNHPGVGECAQDPGWHTDR